jgi:hypothetical protein
MKTAHTPALLLLVAAGGHVAKVSGREYISSRLCPILADEQSLANVMGAQMSLSQAKGASSFILTLGHLIVKLGNIGEACVELSVGERTVPFEAIARHPALAPAPEERGTERIFVLTSKAAPTKEEIEKVPSHQVCIAVRTNVGEIYRIRGKPALDFLNVVSS